MITDMVMPKMNGRELIEKVRVISPSTRIVCGTACTRSVVIEKQLDFLTKPFTSQQLLRKVKEALTAQIS
jgi:two-component system cell cycle sensor histidine kinase/response regulator CckA